MIKEPNFESKINASSLKVLTLKLVKICNSQKLMNNFEKFSPLHLSPSHESETNNTKTQKFLNAGDKLKKNPRITEKNPKKKTNFSYQAQRIQKRNWEKDQSFEKYLTRRKFNEVKLCSCCCRSDGKKKNSLLVGYFFWFGRILLRPITFMYTD